MWFKDWKALEVDHHPTNFGVNLVSMGSLCHVIKELSDFMRETLSWWVTILPSLIAIDFVVMEMQWFYF